MCQNNDLCEWVMFKHDSNHLVYDCLFLYVIGYKIVVGYMLLMRIHELEDDKCEVWIS